MYVILIAIMIFISATLAGIFAPPFKQNIAAAKTPEWYRCCDTGDGEACKPITEKTFPFDGHTYALLKSNTYPVKGDEQYDHFERAGEVAGVGGIYINSANDHDNHSPSSECDFDKRNKTDWIRSGPDSGEEKGCTSIPKKLLVYFCPYEKNNPTDLCDKKSVKDISVAFDVYIKLDADGDATIPDPVKNCHKPAQPLDNPQKMKFRPSPDGQNNLQLRTFKFVEDAPAIRWLAPFCKPAIYLYPEKKTEINVSVYPRGKMLLTIPPYPKLGWDVTADQYGDIMYQNERYDYLYYEASIPDQLITKPKEGYIMTYAERETYLRDLVVKLGLNEKETQQFVEYWAPILPKSPYYFVGVIPVADLHEISPLLITPKPKNLIRVSLYFQALDQKIPVTPPTISPVSRDGFTAVEWGGIFKRDKNHEFSCFM